MRHILIMLALACATIGCTQLRNNNDRLGERAAEEYLTPVHAGGEGRPFWNGFSKKFMYAPSFDFCTTEGAVEYLYTIKSTDGGCWSFRAETPQQPLSPVWNDIPEGSTVTLTVEGMNETGQIVGCAGERTFFRDFGFHPPYHAPVRGYRDAAVMGMLYVHTMPQIQHWKESVLPDMTYPHNTYPCKIIGATIQVETLLARELPHLHDEAIAIARNAAEFLIAQSRKEGEPLAYFPPTYYKELAASKEEWNRGKTMTMEASAAGEALLDLYDATGDERYLNHAKGIADTYMRLQNADGSWHIKLDFTTGEPVNNSRAMLAPLLRYLWRLERDYNMPQYAEARRRGEEWMKEHILVRFDMTGQFEDVTVLGLQPYENLTNCTAAPYGSYLLQRDATDEEVATCYELVRFSEDQFVYWDQPRDKNGLCRDACPCVFEQYKYAMPVDNSACNVAGAMLDLYEQTGDELMFAKAKALIDNITVVQCVNTGKIPTTWRLRLNYKPTFWINCTYDSVLTLLRMEQMCVSEGK
ncbi:MAG: AGE family epimerase/isomerase [Alistipes sp.]|nr:AGE family epimerase/isomerase [Alistipes sp.]